MKVLSLASTMRDIVTAINQLIQGRSNATGTVTLAVAPATTTVVTKTDIPADAAVFLSPTTASAQATTWRVTVQAGQFTITHAADAAVDRTFRWLVIGG